LAGSLWTNHFVGSASFEVVIGFDPLIPTANGRSATTSFVSNDGIRDIFEQGAAGELKTGIDPNGATPDIEFNFGVNYLQNELWFDPTPADRTDEIVPANKTDALSIILHEFGHAFVFNGFRDLVTQELPATFLSTFDQQTTLFADNLFFEGFNAVTQYGDSVALTTGNHFHLGNSVDPGFNLVPDLMNGVVFTRGTRYSISALDLAIAQDVGLQLIPEPSAAIAILCGAIVLVRRRARFGSV
jgi:hypothetical protein